MSTVTCKMEYEGDTRKYTMTWNLPQILDLFKKNKILHTKKPYDACVDQIQMKIKLLECKSLEIYYSSATTVSLKYALYDAKRKYCIIQYRDFKNIPACKWQYMTTLPIKKNYAETYITQDNVDVVFEFQFTVCNVPGGADLRKSDSKLAKDLKKILNDNTFSDVTMKSADGEEYNVHKVVLASRSPVLKAQFEHDFTDDETEVINCPFEAEVLQEILSYIYCDDVPKLEEMCDKLLVAADYYHLDGLYTMCEEFLPKKLTVYNAIDTLVLADKYNANILKRDTLEFIVHKAEIIITTDDWSKLKSSELAKILFERLVAEYKSSEIENVVITD